MSYDLDGYGEMINDGVRMRAYEAALRAAITPGCIVADIGAGSGILGLLAVRLGAGRVHAIEPAAVIQVAREIAAANGMADRIDFHQALSTQVRLPDRVDVIVSDMRGILPLYGGHLPAIIDARERLLAPGGVLVPRRDHVLAALVEAPRLHERVTRPWVENDHALDMSAAAQLAANMWERAKVREEELLGAPVACATLDYATLTDSGLNAEVVLGASRAGVGHGFCLWFDTELAEGAGFSNAPGAPELLYGQAFFRWPRAVPLAAGDRVRVRLDARLIADEYVWSWETSIEGGQRAGFRQSTFLGKPMTPESLRRKSEVHVPRLTEDGEIDHLVLARMAEHAPLGDIARELAVRFPARFPSWRDALRRVGDLSTRYSA